METAETPDPGFWTVTSWIQIGYGVWMTLITVGIGMSFGFPAVTIPQLAETGSDIRVTIRDESWIASALTLSSPIGCILSGYLMDKHGRRFMLIVSQIPMSVGWLYISLARSAMDIVMGRIINGIGCGMAFNAPRVYLTEITIPNMRGVVGSFPNIALSIGITLMAALGTVLSWHVFCYICSGYTIALMFANFFLPETPHFLLLKGAVEGARQSLAKFRSKKHNVDAEMEKLIHFRLSNNIKKLPIKAQIKALFKPSSCKPFGIVCVYILFMQMSGVSIVLMWTIELLEDSKSSVEPHIGNFLLGITRIIVGVGGAILLFKIGRKVIAMYSALGLGVVCIILGIYVHLAGKPSVFPQICFIIYAAFAVLGYYSLPFLIMSEIYPLQIRGLLGGITLSFFNVLVFIINFSFPYMRTAVGLANMILAFGVISILCYIYLYIYLPETKNLSLQQIEEYFVKRRPEGDSAESPGKSNDVNKDNTDISKNNQSPDNKPQTESDNKPQAGKGNDNNSGPKTTGPSS